MITRSKHVEAVIRKHWSELIMGGMLDRRLQQVIKACDLWHGRVVDSPQTARAYWAKGIFPSILYDQSGGGRQIKFLVINGKTNSFQPR